MNSTISKSFSSNICDSFIAVIVFWDLFLCVIFLLLLFFFSSFQILVSFFVSGNAVIRVGATITFADSSRSLLYIYALDAQQ